METRHGNEAVIRFLTNSEGRSFSGQVDMCGALYEWMCSRVRVEFIELRLITL